MTKRKKSHRIKRNQLNQQFIKEEPIIVLNHKEVILKAWQLFLSLIKFMIKPKQRLYVIAEQNQYDLYAYLICYLLAYIPAYLGIFIYIMMGGYKYFNIWYLLLMPTTSLLFGLLLMLSILYGVYLIWERKIFNVRKNIYMKYLIIFYLLIPAAWLSFPLKYFWPVWQNHVFYLALIISIFIFVRGIIYKVECFKRGSLIIGYILTALPYFVVFFFLPQVSMYFVRVMRL